MELPTDAEIDCSWGDGSNTQTLVNDQTIVNNEFSLEHSFPINGEYNVTCRQLKPGSSRMISITIFSECGTGCLNNGLEQIKLVNGITL